MTSFRLDFICPSCGALNYMQECLSGLHMVCDMLIDSEGSIDYGDSETLFHEAVVTGYRCASCLYDIPIDSSTDNKPQALRDYLLAQPYNAEKLLEDL